MSELALVAAALSSIINCPVKTYYECVANELEILPNQVLDLDLVHKYSFVKEGDDKAVPKPSFRQDGEKDEKEKIVNRRSRQGDKKDEKKVIHRRSRQGNEKDEKVVQRRSIVRQENLAQVNPDTSNLPLPPQPIQIFFKTSFGRSHSIFVLPNSSVLELKQAIQKKLYIDRPIRLGFSSKLLNDRRTLESYNIKRGDTIHILFRMLGGSEYYVINDDFISPQYNFDFTNLRDDGVVYTRGKELYKRPYGWRRIALNINKYGDNEWLGSAGNSSSEWPVTYHGTKKEFANNIAEKGFLLSECKRFAYGRGIYSTPEVDIAEEYATEFTHENVDYKVVFQNRVNPEGLLKVNSNTYWITPEEENIRPYGLCIKEV
ncbi:unnamed protein product [Rhizophagus irregularis]|nr:unnamed protein product [Rhizophagus irregularis]